jgi:hypothetical protein
MRRRPFAILVCVGALLHGRAAQGGACLDDGSPVTLDPSAISQALQLDDFGSDPLREPFAMYYVEQVQVAATGCGSACATLQYRGAVECGDLTQAAFPEARLDLLTGDDAFGSIQAELLPIGKWNLRTEAFLSAAYGGMNPALQSVSAFAEIGLREVLDVSSSASARQRLDVRLQLGIDVGVAGACGADGYTTPPSRALRYSIFEDPAGAGGLEQLASGSYGLAPFFGVDEIVPVDVSPNGAVFVSVWLDVSSQADPGGYLSLPPYSYCPGGISLGDAFDDPEPIDPGDDGEGLQLSMSWAPALTVVPRSGLAYEPVPEPGRNGASLAALAALALCGRAVLRRAPR